MKLTMLRNLGRGLVSEIGLTEAVSEGCVCDVPEDVASVLIDRGLAVEAKPAAKPVKAEQPKMESK